MLTMTGLLTLGKSDFNNVNEFRINKEFYKLSPGIAYGTSWGKCRKDWGTDADIAELEKNMDMMKEHFVDKGIPVIIGEYGCPVKNKDEDSIKKYLVSVCEAAYDRDMCPVLWDVTDAFYSRTSCSFKDKKILKGLMDVKD